MLLQIVRVRRPYGILLCTGFDIVGKKGYALAYLLLLSGKVNISQVLQHLLLAIIVHSCP